MLRQWAFMVLFVLGVYSYAQTPSIGASNITFSDVYCDQLTISWTAGNGNGQLVVIKKNVPTKFVPSDSTWYFPSAMFGDINSKVGIDEYVVYNGRKNSVTVTNLDHKSTYYFTVFEYNRPLGTQDFEFRTSDAPSDSVSTKWLNVSFTTDTAYQCLGVNEFTFYPTLDEPEVVKHTFSWDFKNLAKGTDSVQVKVFSKEGDFDVDLLVKSPGCQATYRSKVTVIMDPFVEFGLDTTVLYNDRVQCFYNADGSQNSFTFDKTAGPVTSIQPNSSDVRWDFGDGTISTSADPKNKRYSQPGKYLVKLRVITTASPAKHVCKDSFSMVVEVKPRPLDSTLFYVSDSIQCLEHNEFELENRNSVPGDGWWYFGDGNSSQGNWAKVTYADTGRYPIRFEFVDTAGCYDQFLDTLKVLPQPVNFFSGLKPYYCKELKSYKLTPNLSGGVFGGDQVNALDSSFMPLKSGLNVVSYIYREGNCRDTFLDSTWVKDYPTIEVPGDTSICESTSYTLRLPKDSSSFLWYDNSNDSFNTISGAGIYWVQKDNGWCVSRDTFRVREIRPPVVDLGNDTTLCGGTFREVDISADEGNYMWNDGSNASYRILDQSGTYYVTVSNKCGTVSDTVVLNVLEYTCDIIIPNAFSPNSDMHNPVFRASGQFDVTHMLIFNRWGEVVFESDQINPEWDGTVNGDRVPADVYFYQITYLRPEGAYDVPTITSGSVHVLY